MNTRYELNPSPVGPSPRRRAFLLVVAVPLVLLSLVVVKPWETPSHGNTPAADLSTPSPPAGRAATRVSRPDPSQAAVASWPVVSSGARANGDEPTPAEMLAGRVAMPAGWTVGDGGPGRRPNRDDPWVDWLPVSVIPSTDAPGTIVIWPDTGLCTGVPVLDDRPTFITVSAPADLPRGWRLNGWWSDGIRYARLDASVRLIAASAHRSLGYIERLDQTPWPAGRYEIHVVTGQQVLALTMCLRPGG